MASIGERIKRAADLVGGVPKLGDKTGIPKRTIYGYVTGPAEPTTTQLALILKATGVSPRWLVLEEGEMLEALVQSPEAPVLLETKKGQQKVEPKILNRLANLVDDVYRELGRKAPVGHVTLEAATLYNELAAKVADFADLEEVEANLPALRLYFKRRLEQAKPGSGKASAS